MSNKLCYADAVKLLDGGDKGIIVALDKLTGGLLLAGTGGGGHLLLSMFDVQGELGRLNRELVRGVGDRLRGLGRFGRTERHALDPINREMDARELPDSECEVTSAFGVLSEERAVSVANAIIRLWVCSSRPAGGDDLQQAYEDCLTAINGSRPDEDKSSRAEHLARVLRQLAADRERLSKEFRVKMLNNLEATILQESHLSNYSMLRHWAAQAFGDLDWPPAPHDPGTVSRFDK